MFHGGPPAFALTAPCRRPPPPPAAATHVLLPSSSAVENMSCIHLHLGQAGNQIGKAFWGLAEEEYLVEDKNDSAVAAAGRGRASGGRSTPTEAARVRGGDTMAMTRPGAGGMFHYDGFARCLAVDSEPKASHPSCVYYVVLTIT